MELIPIEIGLGMKHLMIGLTRLAKDNAILQRYAKMSEAYDTKFKIEDRKAQLVF